jgi:hypothetical protein
MIWKEVRMGSEHASDRRAAGRRRLVLRRAALVGWIAAAVVGIAALALGCRPTYYAIANPAVPGAGECVRECQGAYTNCVSTGLGGCSKQQYSCFRTCPGVVTNTDGCEEAPFEGPCVQYREKSIN